jgi:hypothetical protein
MVYIKKKPEFKYNPQNLPKAIDFNLATKDLPLERATKTKLQVALSRMNMKGLKETIEYLGDMRYTAMNAHNYKMAAYCKSVQTFAEEYLKSLKAQNRV